MNALKRLILDASYHLNTSDSYQKKKRFFYNLLENDKYRYKKYFDLVMITLIFISVAILIRGVKYEMSNSLIFFNSYVISIFFLIEYLLRLWLTSSITDTVIKRDEYDSLLGRDIQLSKVFSQVLRDKFRYIFSLRAIIDLLAIMPFFHELRLLRIFILFRIFKLFRYAKSFQMLTSVLATKKIEFLTLLMFASVVIFVSSILIYVMEANNPVSPINTLFDSVYWSVVTISTVGYGDVVPATSEGRFVAMAVIIAGIAVLAFTTSIVVSAFTEKLDEIKENKAIEDASKLKEFYLICGYEDVARLVALKLIKDKNRVIVIDEDYERIEKAKQDGLIALCYNPGSISSYEKLHINLASQVKVVLCLREDDVENVYTALTVRSLCKEVHILSLLMNDINRKKMIFTGINEIVYPQELIGMITREFVGQTVAFEAIHALRSDQTNFNIEEIAITDWILNNFTLVEQLDTKRYRVVLLGIYKKEKSRFFFNPLDSTVLERGDYFLVIGLGVFIKEFERYLQKKSSE